MASKPCLRCGIEIRDKPNAKYCAPCKTAAREEAACRASKIQLEKRRAEVSKYKRNKKPVFITDKEQAVLNKTIDNKHAVKTVTRILSPGHPDFAAIAATITPLRKIKTGITGDREMLYAECDGQPIYRRRENMDIL